MLENCGEILFWDYKNHTFKSFVERNRYFVEQNNHLAEKFSCIVFLGISLYKKILRESNTFCKRSFRE